MRRSPLSTAVLSSALLLAGASSCRSATEITLTIRTNVSCAEVETWQGVAVYVGKPGAESEGQAPTLVTKRCEGEGEIGSLVVVPSSDKDELVGVRVVAGLKMHPEECLANGYQGGCIVARRAIRFTPHTDLALDVDLSSQCKDIACDPQNTCFAGGCEPAAPAAPAPAPEGPPSVRCGDDGVFCALTGDVCCLTVDVAAQRTHGECKPASRCREIVLHCDDDTDCPNGGPEGEIEGICALSYLRNDGAAFAPTEIAHSHCLLAVRGEWGLVDSTGLSLCEERQPCADGRFECRPTKGEPNLLPNYHWCELVFP